MRTCDTVVKHSIPYASYGSFKMFKIMTRLCFGVTWRHKVNEGSGCFANVSQVHNLRW